MITLNPITIAIGVYAVVSLLCIILAIKILIVIKRSYSLYEYNTDIDDFIIDISICSDKIKMLRWSGYGNQVFSTYLALTKSGNLKHFYNMDGTDSYEVTPIKLGLLDTMATVRLRIVSRDYHMMSKIICDDNLNSPGYLYIVDPDGRFDEFLAIYKDDKLGRMRTQSIDIGEFMSDIAKYAQPNYTFHLEYNTRIFSPENMKRAIEAKRRYHYRVRMPGKSFYIREV